MFCGFMATAAIAQQNNRNNKKSKKIELLKEIKTSDRVFPIGTIGILHTIDNERKTGAVLIENYSFIVKLKDIKILD